MKLLSRIFGRTGDPREELRPLWHRVVEIAREPQWYAHAGIADSVRGRFDTITLVLALVLLRMEREEELRVPAVLLTELFVEDMDDQRQGWAIRLSASMSGGWFPRSAGGSVRCAKRLRSPAMRSWQAL